jgi:hypothetical protein
LQIFYVKHRAASLHVGDYIWPSRRTAALT